MFLRVLGLVTVLSACSTSGSPTGIEPVECSTTSTLTYDNFGSALIAAHCLECHDTKSPRMLTVEQIRTHASAILDEAVYTDSMPPSGHMTLTDREQLNEWLACGAP